jgi:hypothetical protein
MSFIKLHSTLNIVLLKGRIDVGEMDTRCSSLKWNDEHTNLIRKSERYELDVIVLGQSPVTWKCETLYIQFLLIFKLFK